MSSIIDPIPNSMTTYLPTYDINSRSHFTSKLIDPSKLDPPDQYPRPVPRPPRSHVPQAIRLDPTVGLADLEVLPVEMLDRCLSAMDLSTLRSFRLVNRRALQLVDALKAAQTLCRLVPSVLNAAVRMGIDTLLELDTVLAALHTSKCVHCSSFGRLFNLTTQKRTCYRCLLTNPPPAPKFRIAFPKDQRYLVPLLPSANLIYGKLARSATPHAHVVFLAKTHAVFATMNEDTYEPVLGWIAPHKLYWDPRIPDPQLDDTLRVAISLPVVTDWKEGTVNWGFSCGSCLADTEIEIGMDGAPLGTHVCEDKEKWVSWYGEMPESE